MRAVVLPDAEERDLYAVDGRWTLGPVPGADQVVRRGWAIPGLVDAHCHVGFSPRGNAADEGESVSHALADRDAGALLLRDCGSPVDTRPLLDRSDLPRLLRAGRHIARTRRYIRDLGVEVEPDQLVAEVEKQAAYGGGWVKLVGDWIDRNSGDLAPLWPGDVLRAAVGRAHALGAKVAVHTFSEAALPDLLAAGVDSIEHGTGLSGDQLTEMAAHGTALVPTLINIDNFPAIATGAAAKFPTYAAHMRQLHARSRGNVLAAFEAGVQILTGTDAGGGIEHGRVVEEVLALHGAGLPAEAALAAGSWGSRSWLGLAGLVEGAPADAVIYDTDPRTDLSVLAAPARIILRGRVIR